ncbi:MAG: hypothetical protein ABSH56_21125 [Bryobacteraceae bacterium]|jgi:hypothetical protein
MRLRREAGLKVFLALVWLVCLYRAMTQSIVHDEALTYGFYIGAPLSQIFQFYDANHHFLNTLLMRISASIFGVSEFTLRLPALGGAALYLAAVYRICVREIGGDAAAFLTAALLALNPMILDFMVAARGYGMALGFLMWALAVLVAYVRRPESVAARELLWAGAALSLSIMANLVFAVPAMVLTAAAWAMLKTARPAVLPAPAPPPASKKRQRRRKRQVLLDQDRALRTFWRWLVIPAAAGCAVFILISPVAQSTPGKFYAGAQTVAESLRSLYSVSLAHGGPLQQAALWPVLRDGVAFGLAPLTLLGALAAGIVRRNILLVLVSATAIGCGIVPLLLHVAIHLLYPLDRTGIYFLPLTCLALAGLSEQIGGSGWWKAARVCAAAISILVVAQFLLEFNTRKFAVWAYDADTHAILAALGKAVPNKRPGSVRIANSWQLEPSLNFYAMKDNLTWLQPITRDPVGPGADYYILTAADRASAGSLNLRTIFTGLNSGTILAVPAK